VRANGRFDGGPPRRGHNCILKWTGLRVSQRVESSPINPWLLSRL
jgi:hypothetical protein